MGYLLPCDQQRTFGVPGNSGGCRRVRMCVCMLECAYLCIAHGHTHGTRAHSALVHVCSCVCMHTLTCTCMCECGFEGVETPVRAQAGVRRLWVRGVWHPFRPRTARLAPRAQLERRLLRQDGCKETRSLRPRERAGALLGPCGSGARRDRGAAGQEGPCHAVSRDLLQGTSAVLRSQSARAWQGRLQGSSRSHLPLPLPTGGGAVPAWREQSPGRAPLRPSGPGPPRPVVRRPAPHV